MRRPIIHTNQQIQSTTKVSTEINRATSRVELQPHMVERILRKNRSAAYIETVTKLDATGVQLNKEAIEELIQSMRNEFPELIDIQQPLGIVSKCYLGEPYEVHLLDTQLQIIEHFKRGIALPNGMEKSRMLAMNPNYEFIEVFTSYLCAVKRNGQISIIKG